MAHGLRSHKPSVKSAMLGSQPVKSASMKKSSQSSGNERTRAGSSGPSNQGYQASISQRAVTNLHNETLSTTDADTGNDTEPEDNNDSPNSIGGNITNTGRTRNQLSRSRVDPAVQNSLVASILEAAAAQGRDVGSVVGARSNQPSEPTMSANKSPPVSTVATAPSPVLAVELPIIPTTHALASHLAAAAKSISTSIHIPQYNLDPSSSFAPEGSHFVGAMDSGVTAVRHEGVTVKSMDTSENTKGAFSQASSAFNNGTSCTLTFSAPFDSAASKGPCASNNKSFVSTNTEETTSPSMEVDMDAQNVSASQPNAPSLSHIVPSADTFGTPTMNFVNLGSKAGFMQSASGAFGPINATPALSAFSIHTNNQPSLLSNMAPQVNPLAAPTANFANPRLTCGSTQEQNTFDAFGSNFALQTRTGPLISLTAPVFAFVKPSSSIGTGQKNAFGAIESDNEFPNSSVSSSLQGNNFIAPINTPARQDSSSFGFDLASSLNAFGLSRQSTSVFDNASSAFQTNVPFPVSDTWNGGNGGHHLDRSAIDQLPNVLSGRPSEVSGWTESSAAASRPWSSNNTNTAHSSDGMNVNAGWNNGDSNPFAHPLSFDIRANGLFNNSYSQLSFPLDIGPTGRHAWTNSNSCSTNVPVSNNDVEMEIYDHDLYSVDIPGFCSPNNSNTAAWNDLVLLPFSEPNAPEAQIVPSIEDIVNDVEIEEVLSPLRQRSAPPPVELSFIDLDPQLDWVGDSSALSSPEIPSADVVVYDHLSTEIPSLFEDHSEEVVQYIPFPWLVNGRCEFRVYDTDNVKDQYAGEQVNDETEVKDQPGWEQPNDETDEIKYQPERVQTNETDVFEDQPDWEQRERFRTFLPRKPAGLPQEDAIDQSDSPSQYMHHQSRDTSCFRPLKKLATAMGWAVHRSISHRVECGCL
ncbi:hypothetical protein J132_07384 [Termitomyces sp. J132]|nr:hypothetical protein H2248_012413 [Termitomyces sp. 'cryptogamus']KNZ80096.1 hypothetical protein J132_07384 [Termitomyces sp. J132]